MAAEPTGRPASLIFEENVMFTRLRRGPEATSPAHGHPAVGFGRMILIEPLAQFGYLVSHERSSGFLCHGSHLLCLRGEVPKRHDQSLTKGQGPPRRPVRGGGWACDLSRGAPRRQQTRPRAGCHRRAVTEPAIEPSPNIVLTPRRSPSGWRALREPIVTEKDPAAAPVDPWKLVANINGSLGHAPEIAKARVEVSPC